VRIVAYLTNALLAESGKMSATKIHYIMENIDYIYGLLNARIKFSQDESRPLNLETNLTSVATGVVGSLSCHHYSTELHLHHLVRSFVGKYTKVEVRELFKMK
jgi:hypothetical protein